MDSYITAKRSLKETGTFSAPDPKMAEQTTLESLLEMGFGKNSAEKAVANTGNQGIERAMDWLQEHQNDPDIDEPYVPPVGNVLRPAAAADSQAGMAAQPSAAGTAEGATKDSVDVMEMEKREKVKKLEELMRAKQAERIERERVEEVEREKQRRKQGQELTQVRQRMMDEERMKLVDLQRREKMEDKIAKQRVQEKIARDRAERMRKCVGGPPSSPTLDTSPPPITSSSEGPPPLSAKKEYDESRIQVRLLDGSAITAVFKAQESLAAVRVYVQTKSGPEGQDFNLLSAYPHHVYTEMDMEKPLKELGLVPSAVLIVTKKPGPRLSYAQALDGAAC